MIEKWEYETYRMNNVGEKIETLLPPYGEQGWELVALLPQPPHTQLIFKRRKQ